MGLTKLAGLPFSMRLLLEAALRNCDGYEVTEEDVKNLAGWNAASPAVVEIPFKPARVVLQDFTGVPCVVDLAAMRAAMKRLGGDPKRINPLIPVDLVIDHSVQVDRFATQDSLAFNVDVEFERNQERYEFLRWGQKAFNNFRVVPPAVGIVHQVNLEYLAKGVFLRNDAHGKVAVPDTLVGTDSHTTMINGLGVLGWGVGGIEAEAVMLGQPLYMLLPQVVGFEVTGELPPGTTATDLVLTITQILRKAGVVNKFVEFYGPGVAHMKLADRATIGNMAPEYGATMGFFPFDDETLEFLRRTGRTAAEVSLVERYAKENHLFRVDGQANSQIQPGHFARSGQGRAQPGRTQATARSGAAQGDEDFVSQGADRADHRARLCPRRSGLGAHRPRGQQRTLGRHRPRSGGDRRDHQLHQYQQSLGNGGRRAVGQESRGARVYKSNPTSKPAWRPAPAWSPIISTSRG